MDPPDSPVKTKIVINPRLFPTKTAMSKALKLENRTERYISMRYFNYNEIFQFAREFLPSGFVLGKMTRVNKACYALNFYTTGRLRKLKITEFIAMISVKNGMKPLGNMLRSFRENLQYEHDVCLGLLNLHTAS